MKGAIPEQDLSPDQEEAGSRVKDVQEESRLEYQIMTMKEDDQ